MVFSTRLTHIVPSGMLGTKQWYARPEMKQQLQLEIEVMKPFVGSIKWGVNCGVLPDGRMYWKVRIPIKAERKNGRGVLYNNIYDIMLVYEPDHPSGKWGTSVHAYLQAPHDITWLQSRVNRSHLLPKNIPHILTDSDGLKYLCTSRYDAFGTSADDPRGIPTAKTAILCTMKWLHNFECCLLDKEGKHWKKFQKEGEL